MFELYIERIAMAGRIDDTLYIERIKPVLTDKYVKELYRDVFKVFPELEEIETDLNEAFKHIKFYGNYTKMKAVNNSSRDIYEGKQLPFRPDEEAFGRLTSYFKFFEIFFEGEYVKEIFLNPANNDKVPERTRYNAGLSIKPLGNLDITFEVKNITDNQVFDLRNYPLPGISYYFTLTYEFP